MESDIPIITRALRRDSLPMPSLLRFCHDGATHLVATGCDSLSSGAIFVLLCISLEIAHGRV